LLAEAARSECAPSMRAVEGNQTALTRNAWKEWGQRRPSPRGKAHFPGRRGGGWERARSRGSTTSPSFIKWGARTDRW